MLVEGEIVIFLYEVFVVVGVLFGLSMWFVEIF